MSRDLLDENYYITSGGKIPVKWTAPEVHSYVYTMFVANSYVSGKSKVKIVIENSFHGQFPLAELCS